MMYSPQPIRLRHPQKQPAAELLAKAFQNDPMMRLFLPDDVKRSRFLVWLFGTTVDYCLLHGEVYSTPGLEGVACWLPSRHSPLTVGRVFCAGMMGIRLKLGITAMRRFLANSIYTRQIRKRVMPGAHWYLWALAVEPSSQGNGIGGRLIQQVLERVKIEGMPCFTLTYNIRNLPFYEKHGFEVVYSGEVPKLDLRVWALVRKP